MTKIIRQKDRDRIGMKLKNLRNAAGLSLGALAERTGLDAGHLCRIESGKYNVGIDALSAITEALGKKIEFVDIE